MCAPIINPEPMKIPRFTVTILPVENGYCVSVGCKTFVYGDTPQEQARMANEVREFLTEPLKVMKERGYERDSDDPFKAPHPC